MLLERYPEVIQLTPREKLIFASELWSNLGAHPAEVPVSRDIIEEVGRKMELACRDLPGDDTGVKQPQVLNGFEIIPANGRVVTPEFIRKLLEKTED